MAKTKIRLTDLFRYYRALPHQLAALTELEQTINRANPDIFGRDQDWFKTWSVAGKQTAYITSTIPRAKAKEEILRVAYEYQLNQNDSAYNHRQCFSSSCAMVARYHGKISGDYEYNKLRARFGDTTDPKAQIAALRALGLTATFELDGTVQELESEINDGYPTPVGWLYKGPISNPSGTGHWTVAVGYTSSHFIMNDPYGEANLVTGGYTSNKGGAGVPYSRKNWLPRWLIEGDDTGWFMKIRPR